MTISFCMAYEKDQESLFEYIYTAYNGGGGYIRPISKPESAKCIKAHSTIYQTARKTSIFKINVWPYKK